MSKVAERSNQPGEVWGVAARRNIAISALIVIILMGLLWIFTPNISNIVLDWHGYEKAETASLEKRAWWGDSFGATNALFSGIALVAAITAVAFQVVELGGQRQEIRLQLNAMLEANQTNEKRLKLDEKVLQHERSLWLSRVFKELQSEEVIDARHVLEQIKDIEEDDLTLAIKCVQDHSFRDQWLSEANAENKEKVESLRTAVTAAIPFFHWLVELAIFSPRVGDEMPLFANVILPVSEQIDCIARVVESGEVKKFGSWVTGILAINPKIQEYRKSVDKIS